MDLQIVYFEIADTDFEKVKGELEVYGFVAVSDGSYELGNGDGGESE